LINGGSATARTAYPRVVLRAITILALFAAALSLAGCNGSNGASSARVDHVVDGDTLRLTDGRRVRLVQIDAPETDSAECYADEATAALELLAPAGTRVRLDADPALDDRDRFGRLLRYVFVGSENVNLQLVEEGAASVWFFDGDRGRYAEELLGAALSARVQGAGLWGACPGAVLDPSRGVDTG
jgi:micrococcal nuclease